MIMDAQLLIRLPKVRRGDFVYKLLSEDVINNSLLRKKYVEFFTAVECGR